MAGALLTGVWRMMLQVPPALWRGQLEKARARIKAASAFLTPDHRRVQHESVRLIAQTARPVPPEDLAARLGLPLERTNQLLDDLEKRLTYLWRNRKREVLWAYPVTAQPTPHRASLGNGGSFFAA